MRNEELTLHERLFLARERTGADQKQWAQQWGISQAMVSQYERGVRSVPQSVPRDLEAMGAHGGILTPLEELVVLMRRHGLTARGLAEVGNMKRAQTRRVLAGVEPVPDAVLGIIREL